MTRREQRDAEREIRRLLDGLISDDMRRLVEAWALTWDQVSGALVAAIEELTQAAQGGRVTRSMVNRSQRLQLALDAVIDSLGNVTGQAARQIENTLRQAVDATVPRWVSMIGTTIPQRGAGPSIVAGLQAANPAAITAMIRRSVERVTHDMGGMAVELATIIRGELLRGISVGDNPRTAARRMVRRVEDRWDYSLSRAMTVSRTEIIDAHRAAARETEQANADVLAGWEWSTHLDKRTCRACIAMHGRRFPLDEAGPEGHQNCRCARRPVPKSWKDLGINLPDTTPTQADREREVDDFLAGLSSEELQRILGQRGLAAYEAGNFPVEDWVRVRQNPGWRDSRVPAPAPAAA